VGTDSALFPGHTSAGGQLGHGNEFDYWRPTCAEQLMVVEGDTKRVPAWRARAVSCGINHSAAVVEVP
jgi:hypothetical protein